MSTLPLKSRHIKGDSGLRSSSRIDACRRPQLCNIGDPGVFFRYTGAMREPTDDELATYLQVREYLRWFTRPEKELSASDDLFTLV
jgi:hypothetical protein